MADDKKNSVFSNHAVCLVLDYGSQYTQLIARRIRDNGVLSMLLPGDVSLVRFKCSKPRHAVPGGVSLNDTFQQSAFQSFHVYYENTCPRTGSY